MSLLIEKVSGLQDEMFQLRIFKVLKFVVFDDILMLLLLLLLLLLFYVYIIGKFVFIYGCVVNEYCASFNYSSVKLFLMKQSERLRFIV